MPSWTVKLLLVLGLVSLIPLMLIARARVSTSKRPRIHLIHDMDHQDKYRAQSDNPLFADGRAMRPPPPGTVAQGEERLDDHYYRGLGPDGEWARGLPTHRDEVALDRELFARGEERYRIHCGPCHGLSGAGDGMVHQRAEELKSKGRPGMAWVQPTSYHQENILEMSDGELFHVASNGRRNMLGYASQISVADRWAIVAYIRALQRSQNPIGPADAAGAPAPPRPSAAAAGGSEGLETSKPEREG